MLHFPGGNREPRGRTRRDWASVPEEGDTGLPGKASTGGAEGEAGGKSTNTFSGMATKV